LDWNKIVDKAANQSKIVMAIFETIEDDENLFNCLSRKGLAKKTRVNPQTIWRNLKELSDEKREGQMAFEAARVENRIDSANEGHKLGKRMRRSLRYPMLVAMDQVYTLHPETLRLMRHGWRPYVPANEREAMSLLARWKNPRRARLTIRNVRTGDAYRSIV